MNQNLNSNEIYFINLVKEMRKQQTLYFATRNAAALQLSKKLEKQVDEYIRQFEVVKEPAPHPKAAPQLTLI